MLQRPGVRRGAWCSQQCCVIMEDCGHCAQSPSSLTDAVPVLKHHAIVACGIGYWILASTSYPEKAILHFRLHLPI